MPAAARSFPFMPHSSPAGDDETAAPSPLTALRAQVADVVTATRPAGPPWATGIASLDSALGGGIPRGRITEVVGAMGAGRATLLRETVSRVLAGGGWVAWVDARRTAAPQSWAGLGNRLVMIRPREARRGAWCADQLLRSGVFALVVLDGAPPLSRVQGVRLAGIARERDAGFVVIGDGGTASRITGALRLRVTHMRGHDTHAHTHAHGFAHGFLVLVEKGGTHRTIEVNSAVIVARRMSAHSEVPDRRGVARGTRRPWAPRGGHTSDQQGSVTWGGLGASVGDVHGNTGNASNTIAAHAIGGTGAATGPAVPGQPGAPDARTTRDHDRRTRDWAQYRGRRRAAESRYSHPSRRESRREQQCERERERTREHARERTQPHERSSERTAALGCTAAGVG